MITSDIQKLEPGSKVEFYELDLTALGGDVLYFHPHADGNGQSSSIWWQGIEYHPHAINTDGFELTGKGTQPSPTLSVANMGYDDNGNPVPGWVGALCIHFDDLVGAKLTRRMTLVKYLDARNFPDGNPTADPNEAFPDSIWIVEQKTSESRESVEFQLSTALDFSGQQLPGRQIISGMCGWLLINPRCGGGYRGAYCAYTGSSMFDEDGNQVFDPVKDRCGGRVSDCKKRFGETEQLNYGGFPAADRLRGY